MKSCDPVGAGCLIALVELAVQPDGERAEHGIIEQYLGLAHCSGRDIDREQARGGTAAVANHHATGAPHSRALTVEEIASAVIPAVTIGFIKAVIVVGGGIESRDKGGRIDLSRCVGRLGEEVIAVVGIGIAGASGRRVAAPAHRPTGKKQPFAAHSAGGHLAKVVEFL